METTDTHQYRPVHRRNLRPPPDCVGVDVGWESDCSHRVEPAREQDHPCEPPLILSPPRNTALASQ